MHRKPKPCLSLLIVDDHAVVREGLEAMLGNDPGIGRIVTAANVLDAIHCCESLLPDVVLLDLRMPVNDGFSALRIMLGRWPALRVIILSASATAAEVRLARREGAVGFLSKSEDRATLLATLRKIAGGGHAFPAEARSSGTSESLTAREFEVLQYLGRGLNRIEIGVALGISEQTVKSHIKAVFKKLDATDRAEAVARGYELGLLS